MINNLSNNLRRCKCQNIIYQMTETYINVK
nr:MAG TPA: hypothetical protein [Caudoviricetes sp.]